ncbi:unnamed protein product [Pieris brassicae]|uniref:Uncharacterized protein n=1 Tax=Pieris brassicae TaxID=7116 RepID=A0A9P0SVG3_PIEBR|nr:unnamed protein product [Pieris brassicae]
MNLITNFYLQYGIQLKGWSGGAAVKHKIFTKGHAHNPYRIKVPLGFGAHATQFFRAEKLLSRRSHRSTRPSELIANVWGQTDKTLVGQWGTLSENDTGFSIPFTSSRGCRCRRCGVAFKKNDK